MIYRILVDHLVHTAQETSAVYVLTRYHMETFSRSLDTGLLLRLSPLVDKVFPNYESFALVLGKILGKSNLERFARQLIQIAGRSSGNDLRIAVPWRYEEERRLVGPGYGYLADRRAHSPGGKLPLPCRRATASCRPTAAKCTCSPCL